MMVPRMMITASAMANKAAMLQDTERETHAAVLARIPLGTEISRAAAIMGRIQAHGRPIRIEAVASVVRR